MYNLRFKTRNIFSVIFYASPGKKYYQCLKFKNLDLKFKVLLSEEAVVEYKIGYKMIYLVSQIHFYISPEHRRAALERIVAI